MKIRKLFGILLVAIALSAVAIAMPLASADTLQKSDFSLGSFAKVVDYYDYVRSYASANNITLPNGFDNYQANTYITYVNTSGVQVLYTGLENVTHDGSNYLNIPMQSIIMHYKTSNDSRDVVAESTFLMLMAFQESPNTSFPGSPTINDTLYASFSLGYDLSFLNATFPALNSQTELIPLTHSEDNLTWSWGMTYTNMTALWWRTYIDPSNPYYDSSYPVALSVYDELSFTYNLTIDPAAHTATLTENHVIGRMRDLFIGASPLLWLHYNSTGTYGLLGRKLANSTIYDFIQNNGLEMSVVNYQTLVVADHATYSTTTSGENSSQTEAPVSSSSITTYADYGEKIFNADFGTKQNYELYNYTADPTESTYSTYPTVTRTAKAADFAGNPLFEFQTTLARFLPLIVAHMYPSLYAQAQATISDISKANYFYITSYPEYSGYKIVHDPTFTAYIASPPATTTSTTTSATASQTWGFIIAIVIVTVIIVAAIAAVSKRRKNKK
jgi:hypothetical protein